MRVAVIDLGTNAARLFIFELNSDSEPKKIFHERAIISLGERLYEKHLIELEYQEAVLNTFKGFASILNDYQPEDVSAIATAALRAATNSQQLVDDILEHTGIKLEIISEEREAELISKGVLSLESFLPDEDVLLIDIGGGSTELIFCQGDKVRSEFSVDIGASRAQHQFLKSYPPSSDEIDGLRKHVGSLLKEYAVRYSVEDFSPRIIGCSGSLRALSRLHKEEVNDETLSADCVTKFINRISDLSLDAIRELPTMQYRRAEHILGAAIILEQILELSGAQTVSPSPNGLKDGIVEEMRIKLS